MRAALVGVDFGKGDFAASLDELSLLAKSAGAVPIVTITGRRGAPDAALFVGSGKAQEVADAVLDEQLEIVIFNHALSPAQQRNLERALKVRVLDRTSLILDIFAQRAKSHEGKVQVELAQLQHLATRLIRGWTHLERQKGVSVCAAPGKRSWKPIADCSETVSRPCAPDWKSYIANMLRSAARADGITYRRSRWWDTPMPENRPCSTHCRKRVCMLQINCLRRWIQLLEKFIWGRSAMW